MSPRFRCPRGLACALAVSCALTLGYAAPASASGVFFDTLGGASDLQPVNDNRIESRLRVDRNNWDTRLEVDSFPNAGDNTANVSNNLADFENETFGFDLSFDFATGEVTWVITDDQNSTTPLVLPTAGFGDLNTIQLFTVGSRGSVTLTDVTFDGLGKLIDTFPNVDTNPVSPTFEETFLFFGNGFDLLAGDWSLTGDITFGTFTHSNPSEGSKITVKLREAVLIPEPASLGLLGVGAAALAGRRRRG
ncbi:MAG: PEP-CTERM sorting domain-containing protein [Planctomycetota bacterium]